MYGKTGTGKTAITRFVGKELQRAGQMAGKQVFFIYINCELVDTQYRVLTHIANHFIDKWEDRVPFAGWPTAEVYDQLKKKLEETEGVCIIVLDEIDKLVFKAGDDVLYNLSRLNDGLLRAKVSVIGISNDTRFMEFLDPRVKSSLGEESMVFPPYEARQLEDILTSRAKVAFNDGALDEGVLSECARLAAEEHGDARRALDLLRVAAEIAERNGDNRVSSIHVRRAQHKIELDRTTEVVRTLPTQSKLVLLATLFVEGNGTNSATTGDVYDEYRQLCRAAHFDALTQRRITDLISELDMLGLAQARMISKGRYGRTKEIQLSVPSDELWTVLLEDTLIEPILRRTPRSRRPASLFALTSPNSSTIAAHHSSSSPASDGSQEKSAWALGFLLGSAAAEMVSRSKLNEVGSNGVVIHMTLSQLLSAAIIKTYLGADITADADTLVRELSEFSQE
jgi:cell division control protein 6